MIGRNLESLAISYNELKSIYKELKKQKEGNIIHGNTTIFLKVAGSLSERPNTHINVSVYGSNNTHINFDTKD